VRVRETADANNNLNATKLGLEYAKNVGTIVIVQQYRIKCYQD
jgi:hypothetical protein